MAYQNLLLGREDSVLTITINRPAQMNALDRASLDELVQALREADRDEAVKVIIITGSEKFFCTGADISGVAKVNSAFAGYEFSKGYQNCFATVEEVGKPVIAAVRGYALGGGLELLLACDLRIVAEDARLGVPEVKLGALPAGGGTARLPRLLGAHRAKELMFFGDPISGREAVQMGIANKAVPAAEVLTEAKAWAQKLAQRAPLAVRVIKHVVQDSLNVDLSSALDIEAQGFALLTTSEDFKEATAAFLQKRPAVFKGK